MDRHAQQTSPRRGAASLRPDQQEAFDGLLLALLARKRLMVLAGGAGAERADVFARVAEQVAADGALVLPVVAQHGMQVEDLVAAAAAAAGIQPPAEEEPDFDALIGELESRLDLAGSGLLAVDDAHLLTAATLMDLAELSRSETASGRFVQVLMSGAPDLERLLARPALQQAVRDLGVIYRLVGDAPPSATPQEHDEPAVTPLSFNRTYRPPLVAPEPAPEARPASDWTVPPSLGVAPPAGHRRVGAWAAAALLLAVVGAGAVLAVQQSGPDLNIDRTAADLRGKADTLWAEAGDAMRAWSRDTFGWPPDEADADALALERSRYPALPDQPPGTEPRAGEQVAALPPPTERPQPRSPAAEPPAVAPVVPELPRAAPTAPPQAAEPGPLPPTFTTPSAAAPDVAPVALPDVPPPPAAPSAVAVAPTPAAPNAAPTADSNAERVRALVEQARRQMAGKRLTTPPGDNANETVQRIREVAPDSPEIPALVTAMVETYRRWAAYAEKDGNSSEARRYLERALVVSPDDPALRAQLKGDNATAKADPQTAKLPSSEAADGFADQETTLAILGQPATLRTVLAAGQDPNKRLENGKTPLMLAAEAGLRDAARQLIERGANPNLRTRDGATAIMYAAWNGRDEIVSLLADAGANVNAGNDDGKTALMAAAARGHAGVVRALLARGAVVDRAANHGWTALMYAAHAGNEAVVRLLVDAGANPQRTDQMGNSAVSLGRQQGHAQVVGALMGR